MTLLPASDAICVIRNMHDKSRNLPDPDIFTFDILLHGLAVLRALDGNQVSRRTFHEVLGRRPHDSLRPDLRYGDEGV